MKEAEPEVEMEKRTELDDFVVYQADLTELKEACLCYPQFVQDKIEELENFFLKLKPDEFTVKTINQWFDAKNMSKCRIHRLLAYVIRTSDTPEEKYRACFSLVKKVYRTDLVRQYRPLILCVIDNPIQILERPQIKNRRVQPVLNGLTINGHRIDFGRVYTEEDFFEVLGQGLRASEFDQPELLPLLGPYCLLIVNQANKFSDFFLKKNRVGRVVQSNEIYLESNSKESEIQIHVVRKIVAFYRVQDAEADQDVEIAPESSGMPVLAKSTASFRLSLRSSASSKGFFEPKMEFINVTCSGAVLEVYDSNARSVIIRDLGKGLIKKIQDNEIFDPNDEIAIRQITKDFENITDFSNLIRKLIADKNTLRLVLVMRMNRLLIREVLKSPVLLVRLCSDPLCKSYLQLLKFWHMGNVSIYASLTALLEYVRIVRSDISQQSWEETVVNLFFRERENNDLLKFSALFSVLNDEEKRSLNFLIKAERLLELFRENNWIFLFALYFREFAHWLLTTEAPMRFGLDAHRIADLMSAHPGIWDELRNKKQSIQELPECLFQADHLHSLLLQNEDKVSRDAATIAINRSEKLFIRLCSLADTVPDELLKYFSRYHKAFRKNWPLEFSRTERRLLSVCKESTLKRYFESYYLSLRDSEFCQTFCAIVLENHYPAVSQATHRLAVEVLITVFLHGLRKKRRFETIWDTSLKMFRLSEWLQEEPRLVYIVRTESILSIIREHPNRELLLAFVSCVIDHHSDPRINHIFNTVPLLRLLKKEEVVTVVERALGSNKDRFFILKSLIHNPDAFGLLIMGDCDFESDEFNALISEASGEHLMLLLIALHSRQEELEKALAIYVNMPDGMRKKDTNESELIRRELELIQKVQRDIVEYPQRIECFFDPTQSSWIEIACFLTLCPELTDCIDPESLDQVQIKNYQRARAFIQILGDTDFERRTDFKEFNTAAFVQELNQIELSNPDLYYHWIDGCLLKAFQNIDVRVAILNSHDLLKILMTRADLRLIAKFVVLFGRSEIAEDLMKILCGRLMVDTVLVREYRPFIYLGKDLSLVKKTHQDQYSGVMDLEELSWSIRHSRPQLCRQLNMQLCSRIAESASNEQVVGLLPYCEPSSDSLRQYLESLSDFEHLAPRQVINLLILGHHLKIDSAALKGWFAHKLNPRVLCNAILNQSNPTGFILNAVYYLLKYYPESEDLVNQHISKEIDFDSCRRADVSRTVRFMISEVGLEVVFPEGGEIDPDLAILICELFFLCDLSHLKLFTRMDYVKILIQYIRAFNTDTYLNQTYLFPRIALILTILYEQNPDYVEEVFEQNTQFIGSFKVSYTSLEIILSSTMYEKSARIRKVLDIYQLADDFIFLETSPVARQVSRQVSSLREGESRRAPLRRNRMGGSPISVPGSSVDSEHHSSSSFNDRK